MVPDLVSTTKNNATANKRGGVFLCLYFALLLTPAGRVQAECVSSHQSIQAIADKDKRRLPEVPEMSPESARKKFEKAYAPIDALVYTEGTSFSASKTLDRLWKLYGLARASGECSPELRRLLATIAHIEFKRGYPDEGTAFAEAALSINPLGTPKEIGEAILLHHHVANAIKEPTGRYDPGTSNPAVVGIKHSQAAVDLEPRDPALVPLERFGLRQSLGFWLHEGKRFAEAREVNEKLLADAERELGKEDVGLLGVIENLAQNTYELKQFDTSEAYLQRCMALAIKHADLEVESRMLFQLGVLAYERGKPDEARRYMDLRVEHAKRNPGHDLLDKAQASRAELEGRIHDDTHKATGSTR